MSKIWEISNFLENKFWAITEIATGIRDGVKL